MRCVLRAHFPVDVFQTGSGTSTNTNINEVIANRASQLAGQPIGSKTPLHPNDDVNLGQSSNDVMPAALHVSVALVLREELRPALDHLQRALADRSRAFAAIVKIGRTGARVFADACVHGIEADAARCAELVQRSLMLVTALSPHLGYDAAAAVAREALTTGRTLREVVLGKKLMDTAALDRALDPRRMTKPKGRRHRRRRP